MRRGKTTLLTLMLLSGAALAPPLHPGVVPSAEAAGIERVDRTGGRYTWAPG